MASTILIVNKGPDTVQISDGRKIAPGDSFPFNLYGTYPLEVRAEQPEPKDAAIDAAPPPELRPTVLEGSK